MKRLLFSVALLGVFLLPQQSVFAWEYTGVESLNPMPAISYLNPLPYFGIGENKTTFSLNPFKGFKNCETCKADPCKKVKKTACNQCEPVIQANPCMQKTDTCPCGKK